MDTFDSIIYPPLVSLDCCKPAISCFDKVKTKYEQAYKKKEQEEQTMYANANAAIVQQAAVNPDADKIKHLTRRLQEIYSDKDSAAMTKFGYNDDDAPKSPKEMIERIKAGDFKFMKTAELEDDGAWNSQYEDGYHSNAWNYISWRIKPTDVAGYKAWRDVTKAEKQKVEDTIRVMTPAEGLAALQAFESTTIN